MPISMHTYITREIFRFDVLGKKFSYERATGRRPFSEVSDVGRSPPLKILAMRMPIAIIIMYIIMK